MRLLAMESGSWVPADLSSYENEEELELLLLNDTSLIPGGEGAAAVTQFPLAGGAVDLLCLDEHGTLTLVECKLKTNREIRRQVMGQVLAYAAALAELSTDDVLTRFDKRLSSMADKDPRGVASRDVATALTTSAGHEISRAEVAANVQANLDKDAVRIVIAVDRVVEELRAVIEYLSRHLPPQIQLIALEVGQFQKENVKLLAVNSYGNEVDLQTAVTTSSHKHKWTRAEVIGASEKLPDGERALVGRLFEHADYRGAVFNGGTGPDPSAGLYYSVLDKRRSFWSIWMTPNKPTVSINLGSINSAAPEKAAQAIATLSTVPLFAQKLAHLTDVEKRYPNFLIADIAGDELARSVLIRVLDDAYIR